MLNISIDATDHLPHHVSENLSYNDQESIIELVVEKVLGFENAIEEQDDADTEDYSKVDVNKIDLLLTPYDSLYSISFMGTCKSKVSIHAASDLHEGFSKVTSPPPKMLMS